MHLGLMGGMIAAVALAGIVQAPAFAREGAARVSVHAIVETACSVAVKPAQSGTTKSRISGGKLKQASPVRVDCSDASGFVLSVTDEAAATSGRYVEAAAQPTGRKPIRRFYTVTY